MRRRASGRRVSLSNIVQFAIFPSVYTRFELFDIALDYGRKHNKAIIRT